MVRYDAGERWFAEHSGELDRVERISFALRAVGARVAALLPAKRRSLGVAALPSLPRPSGSLARQADALAGVVLPAWLLAHSARTFAWAALLAERDGLSYDSELLYAASVLHDLGLCERFAPPPGGCFAVSGARAAEDGLRQAGADAAVAARVGQAVALHLEISVALSRGTEAHLLNRGAALDVIGREAPALERALRDEVVARWPRQSCKAELAQAVRKQARDSPDTRIGLLVRMGFVRMIEAAPFFE